MLKFSGLPFSLAALCFLPFALSAQPKIRLLDYASGFNRPVDIAHCGDSRLFIVEQRGYIWMLDSLGNRLQDTFLNIDARVRSTGNEQGLLGLAFPPDYAQSGYFYVNYTREPDGDTRVARFSRDPLNPNKADPNSELPLFTQDQPYPNHNGGCLKFGPDGYLYIGLGDGGSGNDPQNNGQNKKTFLGKILRLDVGNSSMAAPYQVPADNPFVGNTDYLPEIWSLGWRNPWRFSFDRLTGDLWVADVGQGNREEVDFEPAGTGGRNYGWRCYEGTQPGITGGCQPASAYTGPVFDYDNSSQGCSVTGGFVYRGSQYSDLYGKYLHTDYCSGRWWALSPAGNGTFTATVLANLSDLQYSSLGEDRNGELYVALLDSGKIQRITELCSTFRVDSANIYSPVCANSLSGFIFPAVNGGSEPLTYNWSNGRTESNIVYLNPGTYSVTITDARGCVRRDSFEIEQKGPDAPVLTAGDTVLCPGQSITLTVSDLAPPSELTWYRNDNNFTTTNAADSSFSLTITEPGIYQVFLTDSICPGLHSNVISVSEDASLNPLIALAGDTVVAVTPCNTCQWLLNNEAIPGATGQFHVAQESGTYQLQVTSAGGCTYLSQSIGVIISSTGHLPASVRRFTLAPNPAEEEVLLSLELEKLQRFTLSLSDTQQRQLFLQTHQKQQFDLPIDLRAVPAGAYFLTLRLESGAVVVRKIVKK